MVFAGQLNTLCAVERKGDDLGLGLKVTYEPTGAQLWCSVEQLSGSELTVAQQLDARANVRLTTHFTTAVRVGDRLVHRIEGRAARTFGVVAIDNERNRNRELCITAVERVEA